MCETEARSCELIAIRDQGVAKGSRVFGLGEIVYTAWLRGETYTLRDIENGLNAFRDSRLCEYEGKPRGHELLWLH